MDITRLTKESFSVIGKEGSTDDGPGFIQKLWADANAHYAEIEPLVKKAASGAPVGFWGAMSDMAMQFQPWEDNLSRGRYLAGAEVIAGAEAPAGWTKWTVPGYECLRVKDGGGGTLPAALGYMSENGLELAGAINEFYDPEEDMRMYLFLPVKRV